MRRPPSALPLAVVCCALAGCVAPAPDGYYGGGYVAPYPTYPRPDTRPAYPPRYDVPPAYRPYEPPAYDQRPYRRDRLDDPEYPTPGIPPAYLPEYGRRDEDRYGNPLAPDTLDPYPSPVGPETPPSTLPPPVPPAEPRPAPNPLGPPVWR